MSEPADALLLVIDCQVGFVRNGGEDLPDRIAAAQEAYRHAAFTRFENADASPWRTQLGWQAMGPDDPDGRLAMTPPKGARIFRKTGCSALTAELMFHLARIKPREIHLAGMDTEASVMATAFALFDRDARVRVRADLCASSNGERVHAAALEMLGLTIGRDAIRAPHAAAPQADRWSRLEAVCRDAQAGRMRRSA